MELSLWNTSTVTRSPKISVGGKVRLTHTSTEPALSRTVYMVWSNATRNGSEQWTKYTIKIFKTEIECTNHHHPQCRFRAHIKIHQIHHHPYGTQNFQSLSEC